VRKLLNLLKDVVSLKEIFFYNEYKKINKYSYDELEELRLKKLNRLLGHFNKYSFYEKHLGEYTQLDSLDKLKLLPVVDKQFIRSNISVISKIRLHAKLSSTSGSTGENFRFYICKNAKAAHSAAFKYYMNQIKEKGQHGCTVGIWGGNLKKQEHGSSMIDKLKLYIMNTKLFPGYLLDERLALKYIDTIMRIKPAVLYGFPTYLYKIAEAGLKHMTSCFQPNVIITSGEQLQQYQRDSIEKYFNKKIYNRYGSCEFSVIAHEQKDHTGLYCNPMQFILENNEKGELLVTDLDNFATPFIRYNIGDLGNVTRKGNWYIITDLRGRANDVIDTPTGKIIPSQFWTILSRCSGDIKEFQVEQIDERHIVMKAVYDGILQEDTINTIINNFKQNYNDGIELSVIQVNRLETTEYGKLKFVKKYVKEI